MMTDQKRRSLLKGTLGVSALMIGASAGLLTATNVVAAWPKEAFAAKKFEDAVKGLLGSSEMSKSDGIEIIAPPLAENGAEVGVSIRTKLPNVDSINILIEKNPTPLAANFSTKKAGALSFVRTRLKIAKSTKVYGVVRSDGKLFKAEFDMKVTLGGCGGGG